MEPSTSTAGARGDCDPRILPAAWAGDTFSGHPRWGIKRGTHRRGPRPSAALSHSPTRRLERLRRSFPRPDLSRRLPHRPHAQYAAPRGGHRGPGRGSPAATRRQRLRRPPPIQGQQQSRDVPFGHRPAHLRPRVEPPRHRQRGAARRERQAPRRARGAAQGSGRAGERGGSRKAARQTARPRAQGRPPVLPGGAHLRRDFDGVERPGEQHRAGPVAGTQAAAQGRQKSAAGAARH